MGRKTVLLTAAASLTLLCAAPIASAEAQVAADVHPDFRDPERILEPGYQLHPNEDIVVEAERSPIHPSGWDLNPPSSGVRSTHVLELTGTSRDEVWIPLRSLIPDAPPLEIGGISTKDEHSGLGEGPRAHGLHAYGFRASTTGHFFDWLLGG